MCSPSPALRPPLLYQAFTLLPCYLLLAVWMNFSICPCWLCTEVFWPLYPMVCFVPVVSVPAYTECFCTILADSCTPATSRRPQTISAPSPCSLALPCQHQVYQLVFTHPGCPVIYCQPVEQKLAFVMDSFPLITVREMTAFICITCSAVDYHRPT